MSPHPDLRQLNGPLDPSARRELLQHVAGCAGCRQRFAETHPEALFSLLVLQPVPEHALQRLTRQVRREIDDDPGRPRRPRRRGAALRWAGVAALAASVLLAVLFGTYLPRDEGLRLASGAALPAPPPAGDRRAEPPERAVEVLDTPGTARVVDFAVGDTQVVMIFDAELKL